MANESLVKRKIKDLLDARGWRSWPVMQGGYSVAGISDRIALRDGVFMAIEAKFHPNKPSSMQKKFLRDVRSEQSFAFVVDDRTLPVFEQFLDAFDRARDAALHNKDASEEDKATLVAAITILVAPFVEEELKSHAERFRKESDRRRSDSGPESSRGVSGRDEED